MGHVALTTMAREFEAARGRAIAIATMGFPAGEAVFPLLGAVALAAFGWRGGWLLASLVCILVVLPLAPILLGTHGRDLADARKPFAALRFLAQRDMLLALPAFMTSGFVSTAIAFHQVLIAQSKGWPPTLFAASFAMFGVSSILSGLASGWLVDKFGARRLALGFLLPSGMGCLILAAFGSPIALFAYMALHGVTNGSYATVTTSLLAEAYGVAQIGAIRATAASVMVVSTALSPLIFGVLVDQGIAINALIAALGLVAVIATAMLRLSGLTRQVANQQVPELP
jgi:MFS family permease